MRVALGADHAGVALKDQVRRALGPSGDHHAEDITVDVVDLGVHSTDPADYPDVAREVAAGVANGAYDRGILICGSGVGMSIPANKVPGIKAFLETPFAGGRHQRRVDKIAAIERRPSP